MASGLSDLAQAHPDEVVVSDGQTSYSRAALNDRVNQVMALLVGNNLAAGDRCGVLAGNSSDYLVAVLAAALLGIDPVPVNWHLTSDETTHVLRSSRCRALFADSDHASIAESAAAKSGTDIVLPLCQSLDAVIAALPADEPGERGFASPLYFTSGTTGLPKATQMSQLSAIVTGEGFAADSRARGVDTETVHLTVGPLYHAGPLTQAVRTVMGGGRVHVMRRFDAEGALAAIDEHRVTDTICVPIHLVRLLRLPDEVKAAYDVSSMRRIFHIAAMMPPEVKRAMIDWFGPVVSDGYGASEVGVVTQISSEEWLERPGSVGRPIPNMNIEIIGEDDRALPPGDVGQIFISNDTGLDISYVDDVEKTRAAHRKPGQFTLGDLGWLDEDGYLFLADRRVDLIISGGVNIYPAEVESHLMMHPAIDDVGVFAVPDPEWGHAVKATVKLRAGSEPGPDLESEILTWLSGRVARFKVPKSIDFSATLPRFSNGKLHRRQLRAPYWDGVGSDVGDGAH
jgi:long-chain acyl-CoA synthetase